MPEVQEPDQEIITLEECAKRLSVTPRFLAECARAGKIPRIKITAKVIRFNWGHVLNAMDTLTLNPLD